MYLGIRANLTILIESVDSEQKITEAIPIFDEIITKANCGVLITTEKAEIIK